MVLGDPTLKPHDLCYMNDKMVDMQGNFQVKAVTHHFSQETGFITSVQPDALVVNDDLALLSVSNWGFSMFAKAAAMITGMVFLNRAMKKALASSIAEKAIAAAGEAGTKATMASISRMAKSLPDKDPDVKMIKQYIEELRKMELDDPRREKLIRKMQMRADTLKSTLKQKKKDDDWFLNDKGKAKKGKGSLVRAKRTAGLVGNMTKALTDGPKAFKFIKFANVFMLGNPVSFVAGLVATWAVENIVEKYRRQKTAMQCVLMMPLTYKGREYTAGINGHQGMVVGDPMGKMDSFVSGMGFNGVDDDGGASEWLMDAFNWYADADNKDFSVTVDDLNNYKSEY